MEPVFRWFKDRLSFLDLSVRSRLGEGFSMRQIIDKTALMPPLLELLRHADIGVTGASVRETDIAEAELLRIRPLIPEGQREDFTKTKLLQAELLHSAPGGGSLPLDW